MQQKQKTSLALLALLIAGGIWGSGFVVTKNTLDQFPPNCLLALRFGIAAILMAAVLFRRFASLTKRDWLSGLAAGTLMFIAYCTQTIGLQFTSAGKNAFLTATYVVMVPFFYWWICKKKPSARNVLAAVICLLGIGLLSLEGGFSLNIGDALTLACGVVYAVHIVVVSRCTKSMDAITFTMLQFIVAAVLSLIAAVLFEPFPTQVSADAVFPILYLGVVCTLVALILQNVGLKYAPASIASIIMSTEAPFGCLFGILFLNEALTWRMGIGSLLIFAAILIGQYEKKDISN